MTAKLSKELSDALHSQGDDRLAVVDPQDDRVYYIVDADQISQLFPQLNNDDPEHFRILP